MAVGAILATLGMIGGARGAAAEAAQAKSNYMYNAMISEFNAKLAEMRIDDAIERGQFEEQQIRSSARKVRGSQKAAIASSGIQLGIGTAADVLTSTDIMAERDIGVLRENVQKEIFAQEIEALNQRTAARFGQQSAAGISPGKAATTSMLSSAGQVASQWSKAIKGG